MRNRLSGDSESALSPAENAAQWRSVIQAMIFPLFFVVMFSLCYVSAFHHPVPRDVGLVVVGPEVLTTQVMNQLNDSSPGSFAISTSTDLEGPLNDLASQKVSGVIELGSTLTVHVASGGGAISAQAVEKVAQGIASASGVPMAIADVAPLSSGDSTGTALFYFLVVCTVGGYITMTVVSQVAPNMRVSRQLGALGVMGVILPTVAFAISSIFVGTYGATASGLIVMVLIGMLYTIGIGLVSILATQLLGQAAIFVVMTVAIFLNFPSSGGAIPAQFLPLFWEFLHHFWIGSGAMQSIRSVIYFDGAGLGGGLLILGSWAAVGLVLILLVSLRKNMQQKQLQVDDVQGVSA
ncbi:hypothetical protein QIE55_31070 [Rhodococcus erythropolis]|uniref:DUF3533 domain-containing protein n=1 Tax=Rhodococcus erythropolis TaxID=1833 RepID=A0AAX3ZXE7_RHOER|nr:hypothetical protein QIE55_31070 [Rhodococcus erythropolis]